MIYRNPSKAVKVLGGNFVGVILFIAMIFRAQSNDNNRSLHTFFVQ